MFIPIKIPTLSFSSSPQLLQYVYATDSPAELSKEELEARPDAVRATWRSFSSCLQLAPKMKKYALNRKRSKPSKLRILIKVVLRCDRGGKWLDENIVPGAGRKKLGLLLGFKGGVAAK